MEQFKVTDIPDQKNIPIKTPAEIPEYTGATYPKDRQTPEPETLSVFPNPINVPETNVGNMPEKQSAEYVEEKASENNIAGQMAMPGF